MGANGGKIELEGVIFLNLTVANATSSQLVYVTPRVTCLFFSQRACKGLCAVHLNLPTRATETSKNQRITTKSNDNNGQDCSNKQQIHNLTWRDKITHTEDNKNNKADNTTVP